MICKQDPLKITIKRCWKSYSKEKLLIELQKVNFEIDHDENNDPQTFWNKFENKLINIVDESAPLTQFIQNQTLKSAKAPHNVKSKLNLRKRLLKSQKTPHRIP